MFLSAAKTPGQVNRSADSILNLLQSPAAVQNDTVKINLLIALKNAYYMAGDYDKAVSSGLDALASIKESLRSDTEWKGRAAVGTLMSIGLSYNNKGNYLKAADFFRNALRIGEALQDKEYISKASGYAGVMYDYLGNYPEAIRYYLKALKIDEERGNLKRQEAWLGNIGTVYFMQAKYSEALEYYTSAYKLSEASDKKEFLDSWLDNIANVYHLTGKADKALEYYQRSLDVKKKNNDLAGTGKTYANIAGIYSIRKEYDQALEYTQRALDYQQKAGDILGTATDLGNIGVIYLDRNKSKKESAKDLALAENYLTRALTLSEQAGARSLASEHHKALSRLFTAIEKDQKALDHYKKHVDIRDSISNEENVKKQTREEMNYGFEKKQAALKADQEKKDAIAEEERKKQKIIRNLFVIGFGFVLLAVLIIFRSYRNKQKANLIIRKQKEEVEKAKDLIEEQKKIVEEKQTEILDSIHYARRIQRALITQEKYIEQSLARIRKK